MEKFTQLKKINETSAMPDPLLLVGQGEKGEEYGLKEQDPIAPIDPEEASKWIKNMPLGARNPKDIPSELIDGAITGDTIETKSEPCKFVSKIFESRQVAHVYHLKASNQGSFAEHMATETYYNNIVGLIDELIEVYQGQYDILEDYETIESSSMPENAVQYFIELAEFIKSTRKIAFLPEDTHLQNIIDEMVSLIYKTLYKLKNLK
jgi:hypothetical protein